ncbi:hypothetical protein MesoLj131c_17030 [Mesorhizobium sp. 131-3-5]|nr:hypothetical protein MesoLj131c_17030 [Mesorhizobium sp. 131-3-5]
MSVTILAEYDSTPDCVEALGALNRWSGRTGIPIAEYLKLWEGSCADFKPCRDCRSACASCCASRDQPKPASIVVWY